MTDETPTIECDDCGAVVPVEDSETCDVCGATTCSACAHWTEVCWTCDADTCDGTEHECAMAEDET